MRTFETHAAQGEISIRRIDRLPSNVTPLNAEGGKYIIGHSETGHHHTMTMERKQVFVANDAPAGMRILYGILDAPGDLVHERPNDTHETIHHEPGIYEYRIGREYDAYGELARQVAD